MQREKRTLGATEGIDGRQVRKARSREGILAAAGRLLAKQGIAKTSVAEVTAEAGRTVGGFYGHWASKEELFTEALTRAYRESWSNLLARHAGAATPLERGVGVLRAYLSRSHRDGIDPGCPIPRVAPEAESLSEELREAFGAETEAFTEALAAKVDGKGRRAVALGMIALMYGGVSMARAVKGTPLADEMLRACREFGALALQAANGSSVDKK
jgi:TetR/AcrR family transcriptional repressor of nem operon